MPKINKEFNKDKYDKQYHKDHYKRATVTLTKNESEIVEHAAASAGMTKSAWIKAAIMEKLERS